MSIFWESAGLQIRLGDTLAELRQMESESVQMCVTSPPFYRLRDYGIAGQIGLEPTLAEYLTALVDVFLEVRRVLRRDGVCFIEMGDSYSGGGHGPGGKGDEHSQRMGSENFRITTMGSKQLLGVPWRLAFALQDNGWILRRDIVWHKPNVIPESVKDRPTCSHTFIFLLAKSQRYYFDGEAIKEASTGQNGQAANFARDSKDDLVPGQWATQHRLDREPTANNGTRNCRDVWSIPTEPLALGHFAAFPTELARRCILAGTSERGCCPVCGKPWVRIAQAETEAPPYRRGNKPETQHAYWGESDTRTLGMVQVVNTLAWRPQCSHELKSPVPCTVLDPFSGAGTTLMVAHRLGRRAVGIELNPDYCSMSRDRILADAPLLHAIERR